jgi:hypothetical protein
MTAASVAGAALVAAWSQVESLAELYAVWAGIGLAMAALLYEAAFTVVTKWFVTRRRTAVTAVTLVGGLASFVFLPLASWLVGALGWRAALLVLAAVFGAVTIPLHALFLRRPPGDDTRGRRVRGAEVAGDTGPGDALRTGRFWTLAAAFAVSAFVGAGLSVHLVAYLTGAGYAPAFAALAAGLIGVTQVIGRLLFASVLRSLPAWAEAALALGFQSLGLLAIGLATDDVAVLVAVALFGVGNGMATLVRALAFSEAFGARWYGTVAGVAGGVAAAARAIAPVSVGTAFDAIGDYRPLFVGLAVFVGVAALAVAPAYEKDRVR